MLYLLFQIGHDRYALEARHAVEVVPLVELKEIPHAPRGVAGLFNYRGQPMPAVDLCALTFGRRARERFSTRIIVVNLHHPAGPPRRFGLIVEHATGLMRREVRDFVASGVQPGHAPYLGPVVMDDQGVIQLLHTEHLLPEAVLAMFSGAKGQESCGAPARANAAAAGPETPHLTPGTSDA